MKDEALKLALKTLEYAGPSWIDARQPAITAIKEALAQPAPVPLAHIVGEIDHAGKVWTPAAQRTWVGLTEERIKEIWLQSKDHGDDWADVLALARTFEAEIKELNHD
jgi:hypothetical protein